MSALEGMHAVGYCRVSTDDHGQDTNIQADSIRKWANEYGVTIDAMYQEDVSGAEWPRKALSEALVTLATSDATILVTYDQSRLTRDADTHLPLIKKILGKGKVIRYVVNGDMDPDNVGVKVLNAVKGVTDSEERRVLRVKTSNALIYKRDVLHEHVGRPARLVITDDVASLPSGKVVDSTIVLSPSQALRFAQNGWGVYYVCKKILNVPICTFSRALHQANIDEEYERLLNLAKGVES